MRATCSRREGSLHISHFVRFPISSVFFLILYYIFSEFCMGKASIFSDSCFDSCDSAFEIDLIDQINEEKKR